jgi:hypothetical protein
MARSYRKPIASFVPPADPRETVEIEARESRFDVSAS